MNPVLVAGTNSWADDGRVDWYCPGHPFGQFLHAQGITPSYDWNRSGAKPFVWSTDLGGVPFLTRRHNADWSAGGAALAYFLMARSQRPGEQTALIVHSHGLQVAAFAAAEHDLKIGTLISMGSPIRRDLAPQYAKLRANTQYWLHVHSDRTDRWQWFGELFDGHLGIVRECPLADRNDFVARVGHSELLRDPAQYHYWLEHQWLDQLKG